MLLFYTHNILFWDYVAFLMIVPSIVRCFPDQIGLTPEEVISKIMANPDVAMAFQNPRVQQAIMDVSLLSGQISLSLSLSLIFFYFFKM